MKAEISLLIRRRSFEEAETRIVDSAGLLLDADINELYGDLFFYKRDIPKAISHYEMAITADPNNFIARYQYIVGVQEEVSGNFVDAFQRYQNAIEIDPSFVDAYIELGGLLVKVGDFEGALRCYTDAINLDEEDIYISYNLVSVLRQLARENPLSFASKLEDAERAYVRLKGDGMPPPKKEKHW